MPGMILDAARLLDEHRDPPRGPQRRVEAQRFGPALQPAGDLAQLPRCQLRLASGPPRLLQARTPRDGELPSPPIHGLPMHTDLSCDLRLAQSRAQQLRGFQPSRFQRIEVPPYPRRIPHARRIARTPPDVTILYGTQ